MMYSNSSVDLVLYISYMLKHLIHLHQYHHLGIAPFNLLLHDLRSICLHLEARHHPQQREDVLNDSALSNALALTFPPTMLSPFGSDSFIHKYVCQ
jgi:hypothetical protein